MIKTRNRKTLIVTTFAGLALMIVLFLEMGMSDQAGIEHAGSVKESRWNSDPNPGLDDLR